MRYAVIDNSIVTNIIEAESADVLPGVLLVEATEDVVIGDLYLDGGFRKPPPDRQAEIEAEISAIKVFLASTDWILVKIAEYQILGLDIETLKTEYGETLEKRNTDRKRINELETEFSELAE
jgi:hypothetical protein